MFEMTREEYAQMRRHDYAGPISERIPEYREPWEAMGATHWAMYMGEHGGTTLGPAVIVEATSWSARDLVTLNPPTDDAQQARRDRCAGQDHPPENGCYNPWFDRTFCPCGAARYHGNLRVLPPIGPERPRAPWFGATS